MAKSLLDWQISEARDLALMRANTKRWIRKGLIKRPGDVQIRARKQMTDPSKRVPVKRKDHAGNG